MKSHLISGMRASHWLIAVFAVSSFAFAADQTVTGNLSVEGDTDLQGNTLSIGTRTDTSTSPGLNWIYTDAATPSVYLGATRGAANWFWQDGAGKIQLKLGSDNKLSLFDQATTPEAKVVLDPAGVSTIGLIVLDGPNGVVSSGSFIGSGGQLYDITVAQVIGALGNDGGTITTTTNGHGGLNVGRLDAGSVYAGDLHANSVLSDSDFIGNGFIIGSAPSSIMGELLVGGEITASGGITGDGAGLLNVNAYKLAGYLFSALPVSTPVSNALALKPNKVNPAFTGTVSMDGGHITTDGGGTITAAAFVGDGSQLTGIVNASSASLYDVNYGASLTASNDYAWKAEGAFGFEGLYLRLHDEGGTSMGSLRASTTTPRAWTLPDADGELALVSQIPDTSGVNSATTTAINDTVLSNNAYIISVMATAIDNAVGSIGTGITPDGGYIGWTTGVNNDTYGAIQYGISIGAVSSNNGAISTDGSGNLTATSFIGDGSGLTGITSEGLYNAGYTASLELTGDAWSAVGAFGFDGLYFKLHNSAGTQMGALTASTTAPRTWTLPDADGELALVSQIPDTSGVNSATTTAINDAVNSSSSYIISIMTTAIDNAVGNIGTGINPYGGYIGWTTGVNDDTYWLIQNTMTGAISSNNGAITTDGSGNLTAASFVGNGSQLTGITASQVGALSNDLWVVLGVNGKDTNGGAGYINLDATDVGAVSADGGVITTDGSGMVTVVGMASTGSVFSLGTATIDTTTTLTSTATEARTILLPDASGTVVLANEQGDVTLTGTTTLVGEVSGAGVSATSAVNKLVKTNSSGKIDSSFLDTSFSGGSITGGTSGLSLNAGGTNQGITLTPSGTGSVTVSGALTATSLAGSGTGLTALNASQLTTGSLPAARLPAYTGDVTSTAGTSALTIASGSVTNAKAANMAAFTIKGNNTSGAAAPSDMTVAQTKTLLAIAQSDVSGLTTADSPGFAGLSVTGNVYVSGTLSGNGSGLSGVVRDWNQLGGASSYGGYGILSELAFDYYGTGYGTLGTEELTDYREWRLPDASGTFLVEGNTTTTEAANKVVKTTAGGRIDPSLIPERFPGNLQVAGAIRVSPAGDLSMGEFTTGINPGE